MIPKIIHFVWIGCDMPDWVERNINEFKRLNPAYRVMIHGEEVLLSPLRKIYDNCSYIASKSDLLRYSALRKFGGWYFDTDFWPFRPLDDIVNAYGLDGFRMLISRQAGNYNLQNIYANAPLAVSNESYAIDELLNMCLAVKSTGRIAYGPSLIKSFVNAHPDKCFVSDSCWFFPANTSSAVAYYNKILSGYKDIALHMCADTKGQMPFAMHLWAGGQKELSEKKDLNILTMLNDTGKRGLAGLIVNDLQNHIMNEKPGHPLRAAADGLAALGYRVEIRREGQWPCFSSKPELIVVWNGMREPLSKDVNKAEIEGIPVLRVEHGFFDRRNYHQADTKGILHWASFCNNFIFPAPKDGAERLAKFFPNGICPTHKRKRGKIVVLGQTRGDTQMWQSEIQSGLEIEKAVSRAIKGLDIEAEFRPHPLDNAYNTRVKYLPQSPYKDLKEALDKAKFVVTINSNAGVESLAYGCPVLCLGPATYAIAGVAKQTKLDNLRNSILEMINGWIPEQDAVQNYLEWLACSQWSLDEFRSGVVYKKLIEVANV